MDRATIAVDIDDTLADHAAAFIEFSNKHYGTDFKPADYSDRWDILWNIDDWDEIMRRADLFHQPGATGDYAVIAGAKLCLQTLSERYNLVVVTARELKTKAETHEWLQTHFDGIFSDVHFVPFWEPNNTLTKADICKQIGATYLIDDVPRHCNLAAEGGITALLIGAYADNSPEPINPDVIRIPDWVAVHEYFHERS